MIDRSDWSECCDIARSFLRSSVPLRLLRRIVVVFLAPVNQFDRVCVLSTGVGALTLLVGHEGLNLLDVVELAIGETQVIPLVETAPDGRDRVRRCQVEELRQVENVEELDTVSDVEPHPVSVGL